VTAADQHRRFELIIRADPGLMRLLVILRELALPQWRLVAGCLYQTVWNVLTGRPRGTGISDYDVIYFDGRDLSWDAEDAVIRRFAAATAGGVGPVEVRNQARVHLWFEQRRHPYPRSPRPMRRSAATPPSRTPSGYVSNRTTARCRRSIRPRRHLRDGDPPQLRPRQRGLACPQGRARQGDLARGDRAALGPR
jgi:hypothetical protein